MADLVAMATGHRHLDTPDTVAEAVGRLMAAACWRLVISGGAAGADTVFARAADMVGIPFGVLLPNAFYTQRYRGAIDPDLLARAAWVRYAVDRRVPPGVDPVRAWFAGHWEADNHTRNVAMVRRADEAVVISPHHPRELAVPGLSGGTAHCVRALVANGFERVWWVRDGVDEPWFGRVQLVDQGSLFTP